MIQERYYIPTNLILDEHDSGDHLIGVTRKADEAREVPTMRVYYDRDAGAGFIKSKTGPVIRFSSQGHAHALKGKPTRRSGSSCHYQATRRIRGTENGDL